MRVNGCSFLGEARGTCRDGTGARARQEWGREGGALESRKGGAGIEKGGERGGEERTWCEEERTWCEEEGYGEWRGRGKFGLVGADLSRLVRLKYFSILFRSCRGAQLGVRRS